MKDNSILLRSWLSQTLVDNPEIMSGVKSGVDIYVRLYDFWVIDIQSAMTTIAKEVLKERD